MTFWTLNITRIILTFLLHLNNFYRLGITIKEGVFGTYQLYFTTWSLYMTLYIETFIIVSSVYTYFQTLDKESKHQRRIWMHHNIVLWIALVSETVTPLIYWTALFSYGRTINFRVFSDMVDHFLPTLILGIEFVLVGWVFKIKFIFAILLVLFVYIPVNGLYTAITDEPLYDIITWKSIGTVIWLVGLFILGLVCFLIYWAFTVYRYRRYLKKNLKDGKY